jgi:hypothetical protein
MFQECLKLQKMRSGLPVGKTREWIIGSIEMVDSCEKALTANKG